MNCPNAAQQPSPAGTQRCNPEEMMDETSGAHDPKQVVAQGYDRVAHAYARLEEGTEWPRMRWLQ